MNRRGATLIEVLVAIFVMAIGMLALLTLFPLGALRMAQAIQDEHAAQAAVNANAVANLLNVRDQTMWKVDDGLTDPFKNPQAAGAGFKDADPNGPSYPVFVDPVGYMTAPAGLPPQKYLASYPYIPRRNLNFVGFDPQKVYKWFTLLDGIDFENQTDGNVPPGTPRPIAGTTFIRDIRFSYAFMCQRPRYADPTVTNVSVVVFNNRPLALTGSLSLPEYAYPGTVFDPNTNLITINYVGNVPPPVRIGDWILDGTPYEKDGFGSAHANFYRIVGIDEVGPEMVQFEVQQPIRYSQPGMANGYTGTAIIMEGVVEVFNRGPSRLP